MITKQFISKQTKDVLEISYYAKSHNASFSIKIFDKVTENVKLLEELIEYVKLNDIKWIITDLDFRFEIPENTVWFKNKKTGLIHCHIEDFEKFYLKNITNLIKPSNVFLQVENNDDGWVRVVDIKKEKKNKMKTIKKKIDNIVGDWNTL